MMQRSQVHDHHVACCIDVTMDGKTAEMIRALEALVAPNSVVDVPAPGAPETKSDYDKFHDNPGRHPADSIATLNALHFCWSGAGLRSDFGRPLSPAAV